MGVLIRDSDGRILACGHRQFKAKDAEVAELIATECVVLLALKCKLQEVIFEGDCRNVIVL
ncbi:hypothetical protein FRX31_005222 [Thalictrum thalictroides]|uniref:RNase H type-1 domain-containing protein n=1 Tax=Thalictrum thalictroides TaxID=46969 RepID=A0A7J6X614_THATH|nr:hypothetical protein FRX31_005222 [Thalictrum thalictroides]